MDSSPRGSPSKRPLETKEGVSEGESSEKRPRIVSDISEISEQEENVLAEDVPAEKGATDGKSPAEVIYELSSDNDESLLNAPEPNISNETSTLRSEKNDEVKNEKDEHKKSDHDDDAKIKSDSEVEESEEDEDSEESSESDDSDEDDDDGDEDNKEQKKLKERTMKKESEEKESVAGVEDLSSDEDSDDDGGEGKKESMLIDVSSDAAHESDTEAKQVTAGKTQRKTAEKKERKASHSSVEEVDGTSREKSLEKRKRLESSDYITKTMADLEDLQEDIHKELAEITEKSLQKRKHKKGSSSNHRDKRRKEKTTSRHKEKGREREKVKDGREKEASEKMRDRQKEREKEKPKQRERDKEKQRNSESRSDFRREVTVGVRKDHEKTRKHHEVDDKPWSYDSRRAKSQKDERKDRSGERHWMQTRQERSSSKTEVKSVVERKVRIEPKESKEDEPGTKETKSGQTSKDKGKEPVKKGIMSDSMRELVRQSIKESKELALEVVEEESDESPEHFFKVQASDVSSAEESEEELEEKESSPEAPKLPPYLPAIQGCRSVEEFQWLNRIEEGTYGVVYRAKDKRTGEIVALKKLKMEKEKEGFPITSLREINTLLKSQHPNIVTVQEIVVGNNMDKIYIVMDFVEHDLKALMETMTQPFLAGEIKTIMIQLLRAVNHLHDNWILHRDIKTSNLLLSNKGILKVGDFGLAREYGSPLKPYTPIVVTLWYRAPELLLGAKEYSTPIDIWSVGCVFAELLTMKPLFNGQSEISQINKIFKELGTPSDKIWPGPPAYSEHQATKKMTFAEYPYNNLRNKFGATLTDNGFDLLNSFLTYDPNRRVTAEDALKHEYFKESPSPVDPSLFPSWPARSEGAKRAKKASPKAPEGGNFYKSLSGDGDGAFHIPVGRSQGKTTVPGFTLKF